MSLVMTVMEVMTVQRVGEIMKQSSASARCIPDWQMIVHHNLKSPGIHGVSKNTQTIAV